MVKPPGKAMYRMLIVDDSATEVECIAFLVKQYALPVEYLTALNGLDALELLKRESFDVLFTDIKMPFMDGLALSREAKALKPQLRIILFSGYNDFEYAKTAIAIGVTEYLMKPIIPDEFLHTMEGVLHAIEKQRMQRREAQMTKRHYLYLAFNQLLDTQERDVLLADCRYLLMLEFDDAFFSSVGEDFEDQLPSLLPLPCDFLCLYPERAVLVFRAESQPTEEGMRSAEQSLRLHIETTYARACFAAYEPINGAADFYAAYQRMEKRADDRLMALSASDGAKLRDTYGNIPVDQMIETLVKGDMESFFEIFDAFEHTLDKHVEFSELYIKFNLSRILIALTQHGAEGANDRSIVERVFMDRDIQQNFEVVRRMAESLAEKRQIAGDPQIEEIKRYLCEHYGADVSLNHIAEIFHFSPNYLCHRFKRATGQNFIQFVNDYRMKMARELLATTDMKVSVIAQTVGFKSASYFCQRYRDCYGTSPESDRQSKPFHLLPEAP